MSGRLFWVKDLGVKHTDPTIAMIEIFTVERNSWSPDDVAFSPILFFLGGKGTSPFETPPEIYNELTPKNGP